MARYAKGVHAKAICDRCGLSYPYLSLKPEWTGLRTCPECWDYKHPSLDPITAVDAESLQFVRAGSHKREDARAVIITGVQTVGRIDHTGRTFIGRQDTVLPAATTGSVSSTVSLGSESIIADSLLSAVSGIAVTTAVGTEAIKADAIIPAATTGSVSSTVSLGNETPTAADPITGIAVSTAVGTESIRRLGWGNGGWNTDNWGHD